MNNKGEYQPAHPPSLISAFVICFMESMMCRLATNEISVWLVPVAEQVGLNHTKCKTPKTGFFSCLGPLMISVSCLYYHRS